MDSWPFAGARWWKFDFHSHTPHSTDYGRGDETLKKRSPREWLLDYMNKGIDCVAITDHNGGAWVDELKREYAAMQAGRPSGFRELVLFPGVEITVNGSIHLLAILDTEKKTSDIDTLLGQCGYGGGVKGESRSSTGKAFGEVTQQIVAFDGIAIPAHADQGAGLFLQMADGNSLPGILKSPFIYSMEIIAKGYACPELFASCKAEDENCRQRLAPALRSRKSVYMDQDGETLPGGTKARIDGRTAFGQAFRRGWGRSE